MRNLKKVLALVVAFSMMLSVVAFAGYKDVPADAEYAGALDLLSSLDIIKGDDLGNFNPDATITRAEMAAIVCRAKGLEKAANGAKGATVFTDVAADHWASGYINLASQNNIINGYGDGKFGPEDTVTYEQVIKMLVCALGFEPMAAANGGWATGYLVVANRYKVTEGAAADATRKNVATLVYNALSTPMMDQTSFGADAEYQILDGKGGRDYKTLLTDMDIYVATGVVADYDIDTVTIDLTETSEDGEFVFDDDEDADNEIAFEKGDIDVAPYMYQSVDVYAKKNNRKDYEVVAIVGSVLGETLTILSDDVVFEDDAALVDGQFEYYVDAANSNKTKKVKVDLGEGDIVFNKSVYTRGFDALAAMEDVEITLIENTSDRTFDRIVATQYTSAVVGYVDADKGKIEIGSRIYTLDFEDEDKEIILVDDSGKEITLADFAEDDVVAYVSSSSNLSTAAKVQIVKLSNAAVTGIVDETFTSNGDDYVVIDGKEYKVGAIDDTLTVGSEGTFYIGITGKIVYFDGSLVGENYAYILEAAPSKSSFSADKWQVKLLTKEDGIVTYDVTDDMDAAFDTYFLTTYTAAFDGDKTDGILFADATEAQKANAARIITFKTNAKGQIRAFAKANGTGTRLAPAMADEVAIADKEYNDKTQIINGATLEDEITIFNVTGDEAEDAYVTDLSYLVDESKYAGYVFANTKGENVAMVVTLGDSIFTKEAGLAIVTKVSDSKNAEDDDIVKVSYIQDGVEGTITFDSESTAKGGKDIDDAFFGIGSILVFNANSAGVVSDYAIIATVGYVDEQDPEDDEDDIIVEHVLVLNDAALSLIMDDEDDAIIFGNIENAKRVTNKKGEVLTVNGETISVSSAANMYTYDNSGRKVAIKVGDFMDNQNMDYYDSENDVAKAAVFVRIVEGVVVDIYGFEAIAE
jgi:hypothetical protein